jgi:hypothetical protein
LLIEIVTEVIVTLVSAEELLVIVNEPALTFEPGLVGVVPGDVRATVS